MINTHIGLFTFKRLPNGIHSGPAIFQRIVDNLLSDIPKAVSRLDDILVAGTDEEDHLHTLSLVLERLVNAAFRLNKAKCKFFQSSVVYLEYVIDGEGLHPIQNKLKAIRNAPRPKDVTALKSFLGLIMFHSRFMPHHDIMPRLWALERSCLIKLMDNCNRWLMLLALLLVFNKTILSYKRRPSVSSLD